MKYAWIEQHRDTYAMCELLSVSRIGLYAARGREPSKRSCDDNQLIEQSRAGCQGIARDVGVTWQPLSGPAHEQ